MGMYDIIQISFKCPYCGKKSHMEFQTKDLIKHLKVFKPGDRISEFDSNYDFISIIGACHSPECQSRADKLACSIQHSPSGFGALFSAKIRVNNGIITNDVFDIEINKNYTDEYLDSIKKYWESYYKQRSSKDPLSEIWERIKIED